MSTFTGLGLPASILEQIENSPVEDLVLAVLRETHPDMRFVTLIPDLDRVPFVQVRRLPGAGIYKSSGRWGDSGRFAIQVFTKDPNGDDKGGLISEGLRVTLRDAAARNWGNPDLGWIVKLKPETEPTRKSDWATSSGPVQYADLPTGHWRYESTYSIQTRVPRPGAAPIPVTPGTGDGLIEVGTGLPVSTPQIGELYFDEASGLLYRYEV